MVEVLVAMVILVIGMLGVLAMLDTANAVTSDNLARDGGTSLAREEIERARDIAYPDLANADGVATALVAVVTGSGNRTGATFKTVRRGVTYTSTISSCVLDDPSDGIGPVVGTPCDPLSPHDGGGGSSSSGPGSTTLNLNVLGIQITGGGTIVAAICSLLGRNSLLDSLIGGSSGALSPLISTGADVGLCSSTQSVALDRQPADTTAVSTTVTWRSSKPASVTQRAVVSGPRVTS